MLLLQMLYVAFAVNSAVKEQMAKRDFKVFMIRFVVIVLFGYCLKICAKIMPIDRCHYDILYASMG